MKLAIIGSRGFDDYAFMLQKIHELIDINVLHTTVSGGAKGADNLAERFADDYDLKKVIFKPEYQRHGRAATFIRNRLIVDTADVLIAFWDGKSTGTKYTIDYAKKQQKLVHICQFDGSK